MNVTNFHARAVTRQTTGAEGGEAALVGQARKRVVLIHELRELGGAEELLDRSRQRADVDQRGRGDRLRILSRHALTNRALHAGQARADLRLNQLTDGTNTTVPEVVDVVGLNADFGGFTVADARKNLLTLLQGKHVADRGNNVVLGQGLGLAGNVEAQLLVDLVASHLAHVVTLGITVEVV